MRFILVLVYLFHLRWYSTFFYLVFILFYFFSLEWTTHMSTVLGYTTPRSDNVIYYQLFLYDTCGLRIYLDNKNSVKHSKQISNVGKKNSFWKSLSLSMRLSFFLVHQYIPNIRRWHVTIRIWWSHQMVLSNNRDWIKLNCDARKRSAKFLSIWKTSVFCVCAAQSEFSASLYSVPFWLKRAGQIY